MNTLKDKIKRALNTGNLRYKLFTAFLDKLGYSNHYIGEVETREKVYRYLEKKYANRLEEYNPNNDSSYPNEVDCEKTIWICWWQGIENEPVIVKRCIESLKRFSGDWNIKLITKENYSNYVTFPNYIVNKWDKGLITNTHMADLLRLELLIKYGGLWVDATVFLSGCIPEYVTEKNLFMFKSMNRQNSRINYNSWFIYAKKNNPLLKSTRYLLYLFWEQENKMRDYFLFHLMMTLVTDKHPEYVDEIYYVPDELPHILARILFNPYDDRYWNILNELSHIHKLSTKIIQDSSISDNYYQRLLNGDL